MVAPAKKPEDPFEVSAVDRARMNVEIDHLKDETRDLKGQTEKLDAKVDAVLEAVTDLRLVVGRMEEKLSTQGNGLKAAAKWVGGVVAAVVGAFALKHLGL